MDSNLIKRLSVELVYDAFSCASSRSNAEYKSYDIVPVITDDGPRALVCPSDGVVRYNGITYHYDADEALVTVYGVSCAYAPKDIDDTMLINCAWYRQRDRFESEVTQSILKVADWLAEISRAAKMKH